MKDLYGLRMQDVDHLKKIGLLEQDAMLIDDGVSMIDSEPLYVIGFATSEERDKAYNALYMNRNESLLKTLSTMGLQPSQCNSECQVQHKAIEEYHAMPKVTINNKDYVDKEIFREYILYVLAAELMESEHRDSLEAGVEAAINTIANLH